MSSPVQYPNQLLNSPENPFTSHQPPRYDIHGNQLPPQSARINLPAVKVPDSWKKENSINTLTQLVEQRRKDAVPDSTYDLNCDGTVSPYEFFVSRLYDADNNGKLTPQQKLAAQNAMVNGELDKFTFGVDASGVLRSFRIIQKRGVILDSDDFSKITSTYPALNTTPGIPKTRSQLLETRKSQDVSQMKEIREKWLADKHILTDYVSVTPNGYVQNPPITSIHQKRELEKQQVRSRLGLTSPSEIKSYKPPGLEYISTPIHRSLSELKSVRKSEMLEDLQQKKNYDHITRDQKLMERDKNNIAIMPEGHEGLTWDKLQEQIKKTDIEANVKKFSNIAVGIHGGKELPKFYDHNQEYWKEEGKSMPRTNSHRILNLERKYWVPKCEYQLSDVTDQPPQLPNGKQIPLFKVKPKSELPDKPNNCIPHGGWGVSDESGVIENKHPKHHYRWSTIMNIFNQSSRSPQILSNHPDNYTHSKTESVKNRPNLPLNSQDNIQSGLTGSSDVSPKILSKKPTTLNIMAGRVSGMKPLPKTFLRSGGFSK